MNVSDKYVRLPCSLLERGRWRKAVKALLEEFALLSSTLLLQVFILQFFEKAENLGGVEVRKIEAVIHFTIQLGKAIWLNNIRIFVFDYLHHRVLLYFQNFVKVIR
jgi:hypothetical protein